MDKNFFTFDIDDEIRMNTSSEDTSQKVQNPNNLSAKSIKNEGFVCFNAHKGVTTNIKGFEKQTGLATQRAMNPNKCKVNDYLNFDFRMKEKLNDSSSEIPEEIASNEEVKNVIQKAQIGVIFY